MSTPQSSPSIAPQRRVLALDFEPGHWKQQLPKKYLDIA